MNIQLSIQILGLSTAATLLALMLATNISRDFRFWPPGKRNLKWSIYWILATVNSISILYLIVKGLKPSANSSFIGGTFLAVTGLVIAFKAIRDLSLETTSGLEKNFTEKGLYNHSRNPQVLGNLLTLLGAVILRPTVEMSFISFVTGLWLVTMIFAEEKWLEEKYGEKYLEYTEKVPRFF